jgi:uncharacterized protein (TIGR02996 family)
MNELVFQKALDAEPQVWSNYLMLADWLEEQGDPRAAGYRWMGENEKHPFHDSIHRKIIWVVSDRYRNIPKILPGVFRPYMMSHTSTYHYASAMVTHAYFMSLSEARDAVAFAIAEGALEQ